MNTKVKEMGPFEKGMLAAMRNEEMESCPYTPGSEEFWKFQEGYAILSLGKIGFEEAKKQDGVI